MEPRKIALVGKTLRMRLLSELRGLGRVVVRFDMKDTNKLWSMNPKLVYKD